MGKIIAAVLIIATILTLGVMEQVFIHDTFNELHDKAVEIGEEIAAEDYEQAKQKTDALLQWWKERRNIVELTSPHNEVKDHISLIAQLQGYLISKQHDDALSITYAIREDALNKLNILAYRVKNVL